MQVKLDIEQPCGWDEHAARIESVRAQLLKKNLDALLVTSLHSIYYLFGIDRLVSAGVFCGVLLCTDKPPVTISYFEHGLIFEQSPLVGEIRLWERDHGEAAETVAQKHSSAEA